MPTGHYPRKKAVPRDTNSTRNTSNALRGQLLALGAEQMYRKLQRQMEQLRRAYPAVTRFDAVRETDGDGAGDGRPDDPAPEALALFRQHKQQQTRKTTPAAKKTKKKGGHQPIADTHAPPPPGSLTDRMMTTLREHGPLTGKALASAIYEAGDWGANKTAKSRRDTINVMLRQSIMGKHGRFRIVGDPKTRPRLYGVAGK